MVVTQEFKLNINEFKLEARIYMQLQSSFTLKSGFFLYFKKCIYWYLDPLSISYDPFVFEQKLTKLNLYLSKYMYKYVHIPQTSFKPINTISH